MPRIRNLYLRATFQTAVAILCFVVLAVVVVFPTLQQLHSTLPTGPTGVATVPLFNTWTIWWNIDRAAHGFAGYWQAPIFHPSAGTFAFSEPQPATLLVAPVYWATGSLIIAYKAYLLLSLVLNGVFAAKLCRRFRVGRLSSLGAGAMIVWLPVGLRQMDVLQLLPVWGILWTWDASWQHCQRPTYRSAVIAALACATCFLLSVHHGLFMIIVLLPALLVTLPWRTAARGWKQNLVAILLAAIAVGTLALPMRSIMKQYQFERTQQLVTNLSAKPQDLLRLPQEAVIGKPTTDPGYTLSPGWTKTFFAVIGIAAGLCRIRKRRWIVFLLLMIVISGLLALGPNLRIGTYEPWWTIANVVPGLQQVRNVFRFAYLTQMGIILLAAIGLSEVSLRLQQRLHGPVLSNVLLTILVVVCVLELPPPNPMLAGVPNRERHRAWAAFIKRETTAGAAVACLPFAAGGRVADFDITTRWMYYGTLHGKPLVNGYSGFFPQQYFDLQNSVNSSGITDLVLQQFASADVQWVVIQRGFLNAQAVAELPLQQHQLQLAFRDDEVHIDVYRLSEIHTANPIVDSIVDFAVSPVSWLVEQIGKACGQ